VTAAVYAPGVAILLHEARDDGDLERMLAIRNSLDARPLTLDGYHAERTAAVANLVLIATVDGRDVGAGWAVWGASFAETRTAFVNAWVLADARRQGVGGALVDRLAAFARDSGMTSLRTVVRDDDPESLAFLAGRGLEVAGRGQEGALDLAAVDPTPVVAPPGIEVTTLADRPDLDRAMYDLIMRVRPEVPAMAIEPEPSFDSWFAETIGDSGFLPGLTVLALRDDRLVGVIEIYDNAGGAIYIGMTAVDPEFRRHGIARFLKAELTRRANAAGMVRIETYNDGTNQRIRALNESLGYVYLPWKLILRGPIPAPSRVGA
jgi:mycothiol synthase